jgi:hypothetical protein
LKATVNHGREAYVRGDVTANTAEGYYSIFKRGTKGVYQHCAEKHLHRYLSKLTSVIPTRLPSASTMGNVPTLPSRERRAFDVSSN